MSTDFEPVILKVASLNVGETYLLHLAVKSVADRKTKAGKPYLVLELFDGETVISGNYWTWSGNKKPEVNTVLAISADVSEWQGTKQLNIRSMSSAPDVPITRFLPQSGISIEDTYAEALSMARSIESPFFAKFTELVLEKFKDRWLKIPGANSIHHAYVAGTLVHCVSTARIAAGIASGMQNYNVNTSLVVAGALLHDLGKLYTYSIDGIAISMTDQGMLMEHTFLGANLIHSTYLEVLAGDYEHMQQYTDAVELLMHVILTHHGCKEFGAAVNPSCAEALIVSHADGLDANMESLRAESAKLDAETKWTPRIWSIANTSFLNPMYVSDTVPGPWLFGQDEETMDKVLTKYKHAE